MEKGEYDHKKNTIPKLKTENLLLKWLNFRIYNFKSEDLIYLTNFVIGRLSLFWWHRGN